MTVSFIGGGNRSSLKKPPTCRKSLINIITLVLLPINNSQATVDEK
jgi:hypothetical protein